MTPPRHLRRKWQWVLGACLYCGVVTGCASVGDYLETREGQGCYRLDGYARGYLTVHGILATGGATMAQCIEAMWP